MAQTPPADSPVWERHRRGMFMERLRDGSPNSGGAACAGRRSSGVRDNQPSVSI